MASLQAIRAYLPTQETVVENYNKFQNWTTSKTISLNISYLTTNSADHSAIKVAKVFARVLATLVLSPFAAATVAYSKVKPNLPQSVTNFIANLHSKFPKLS